MPESIARTGRALLSSFACLVLATLPSCATMTGGGGGGSDTALVADAGTDDQVVAFGGSTEVTLDARGSSSGSAITSYVWSDATGQVLATGDVATIDLSVGSHVITLTVTDADGRTDQTTITITVVDAATTTFVLTVQTSGSGQTDPLSGSITYQAGDFVTLTAIADADWRFVSWSGDISTASSVTTVYMDEDKAVTAEFVPVAESNVPLLFLPFAPGETHLVTQGNNGTFSHQDKFAWDFDLDQGTPVLAPRAGRIVQVVENLPNNIGDTQLDPNAPANVIMLDLGDGLLALFAHLDFNGAKPIAGQFIARGQCLGRSGNSGYSTGPHLHYEVTTAHQQSQSTGLIESDRPEGIALEGDTVTSQNELDLTSLETYVESTLPADAFLENDVELSDPMPPAHFYSVGQSYTVSGQVMNGGNAVCVAFVEYDGNSTNVCDMTIQPVRPNGQFTLDFLVPESLTPGDYLLGIISGTNGVEGVASVPIAVLPADSGNTSPTAVADQPENRTLRSGDIGLLDGSGSFDADDDDLIYQWYQVSGPTVSISNSSSPEASFTAPDASGNPRMIFQLLTFDGRTYSLPAQVEYELIP